MTRPKTLRETILQTLANVPEPLTVPGLLLRMGEAKNLPSTLERMVANRELEIVEGNKFKILKKGSAAK
jgi:hypothetical protein